VQGWPDSQKTGTTTPTRFTGPRPAPMRKERTVHIKHELVDRVIWPLTLRKTRGLFSAHGKGTAAGFRRETLVAVPPAFTSDQVVVRVADLPV